MPFTSSEWKLQQCNRHFNMNADTLLGYFVIPAVVRDLFHVSFFWVEQQNKKTEKYEWYQINLTTKITFFLREEVCILYYQAPHVLFLLKKHWEFKLLEFYYF